jgi:hypothetical protein
MEPYRKFHYINFLEGSICPSWASFCPTDVSEFNVLLTDENIIDTLFIPGLMQMLKDVNRRPAEVSEMMLSWSILVVATLLVLLIETIEQWCYILLLHTQFNNYYFTYVY